MLFVHRLMAFTQYIYSKIEDFIEPSGVNNSGRFDPAVHGFDGLLSTTLSSRPVPISGMVLNGTQELSPEFSFNLDMNSGVPLGIGNNPAVSLQSHLF